MVSDISALSLFAELPSVFWLAMLSLGSWVVLMAMRGDFWRADQRLAEGSYEPDVSPAVAIVVPARDEEEFIEAAVESLKQQNYKGNFSIHVVNDCSDDATAEIAKRAGARVICGSEPPLDWTGKMWAVSQGIDAALGEFQQAEYYWITDADIEHHPGELASLVARSERDGLDLNSVMVKLLTDDLWSRILIPAFVFFFQKLYPFPWVNDPRRKTAAAAGGSMLVRRSALDRIGGIAAIKGELIDDCALAQKIKSGGGSIGLALADETRSLRPYNGYAGVWNMVARTAFHQLRRSVPLLVGTVAGMVFLYLSPPIALLVAVATGEAPAAVVSFAAWFAMAWAFAPTLYRYDLNPWYGFTLPFAGALYTMMTLDSAYRHWRGRGGEWKGRAHNG